MIYSVWNQALGAFDYYDDGRAQAQVNAEAPGHLTSRALGSTVDQAAWPLPAAARPVGRGAQPMGRIATVGGAALGETEDRSLLRVGLVALGGLLAWRALARRRRSRR